MRHRDYGFAWVALLALPALWPLLRPGFFVSDDGLFHLYRLAALDAAFHAGEFFPRWFPDFAFGYGFPVLNFYSPLSYYLGQLFHLLGGGYILSIKLAFGASLLLSALAMYLFARETLSRPAALLSALAYLYAPYHLADVYRRGALAESLAFVFFPLLLWLCHRLILRRQAIYVAPLALAYAGLILVHNLSAMIFTPLLLAYCLWLAWRNRSLVTRPSSLVSLVAALLLALGLAAFYILPVRADAPFAHLIYDVDSTGYQKHLAPLSGIISPFLDYRYFPEQGTAADHPLGLVQAILAAASVFVLGQQLRQRRIVWPLVFWLATALIALYMTLDLALPVWRFFQPLLSMIQYPWRFMALVDLSTAYLIGSLLISPSVGQVANLRLPGTVDLAIRREQGEVGQVDNLPPPGRRIPPKGDASRWQSATSRGGGTILMLALALLLMANALPNLPSPTLPLSDEEVTVQRMWQEDYAAGQIGATWTAEYLPLTVQEERWAIPRPPATLTTESALGDVPTLTLGAQQLLSHEMTVESGQGFPLRLHAFYFPGWQGYVDGLAAPAYPSGRLGLVTVDVPPGRHTVRLAFQDTPARQAGAIISVVSLLVIIGGLLYRIARQHLRHPRKLQRANWKFALRLVIVFILVAVTGWHLRPYAFGVQPVARVANLEGQVKLVGYTLSPAQADRLVPGDSLPVTLYWLALQSISRNYKVFIHLTDAAGQVRAQHDGDPVYGFTPTTRWLPGELVADRHDLHLPADLPPGRYTLLAGMYEFETLRNLLPLDDAEAKALGNRLRLGEVTVVSP